MPFFDTTGARPEDHQGIVWSTFSLLFDQLERVIALNLAWSIQLLPGIAALAFGEWSPVVRGLLCVYTCLALPPVTGAMYVLVAHVCAGDLLTLERARAVLAAMLKPGFRALTPLLGAGGLLAWAISVVAPRDLLVIEVLLRLALWLGLVCAMYWGPLLSVAPTLSALELFRRSLWLVWRAPLPTLRAGAAVLVALVIGTISIGGLFLIVPVLVALLQTRLYQHSFEHRRTGGA